MVPIASVVLPKMTTSWLDHTTWYISPAAPEAANTPVIHRFDLRHPCGGAAALIGAARLG